MNPKSYRILAIPTSTRVRCPVCHEEVYSRAGIHPQCAVRQCDPPKLRSKAKGLPPLVEPAPGTAVQVGGEAVVETPTAEGASSTIRIPV
jgi:hypothetical protein